MVEKFVLVSMFINIYANELQVNCDSVTQEINYDMSWYKEYLQVD